MYKNKIITNAYLELYSYISFNIFIYFNIIICMIYYILNTVEMNNQE